MLSYNLFYSFAYTIYGMSHNLMVPLSTRNSTQRGGLSVFNQISTIMMSGILVALLFPMLIMPAIGVDKSLWLLIMGILSGISLPLTLLEYYFTKERVTMESYSRVRDLAELEKKQQKINEEGLLIVEKRLKEYCAKKGLDYDIELKKYLEKRNKKINKIATKEIQRERLILRKLKVACDKKELDYKEEELKMIEVLESRRAERLESKLDNIPFKLQIKTVFTDKYILITFVYFLIYMFGSTLKNVGLVYYSNYVLSTYNDGTTQMLISVIGGIPMGIGIFAVWPLARKFGKRNVTLAGFILYALGSLICVFAPIGTSAALPIVLVGQFIKNIGGLPCAYVFMALFADTLDHVEWKTGFRTDGTAMSIYSIIVVAIGGICTGVFNGLLGSAGYIAPEDSLQPITQTLEQMFTWGRNNGVNFQTFIQNTTTNTWMTVFNQSDAVTNVITFVFVGLEVITGIVLAGLLIFLGVEKTIKKKQTLIREAQKVAWEKEGKVWIEPEIRAAEEQRLLDEESEKVFRDELALKCDKKGLNYNELLQKHLSEQKNKETKRIENERKNEEKLRIALEKEEKSLQKKKDKFNSLLNSKKSKIETRRKLREEREQKSWLECCFSLSIKEMRV